MKGFLIASCLLLASVCTAKPFYPAFGVSGPLTPLVGPGLVATPKGLRPIALEGFSEDLNMDGYVDPVVPVHPILPYAAAPVLKTALLKPKLPAAVRPEDVPVHSIVSPYYAHPYHLGYPAFGYPYVVKAAEEPAEEPEAAEEEAAEE